MIEVKYFLRTLKAMMQSLFASGSLSESDKGNGLVEVKIGADEYLSARKIEPLGLTARAFSGAECTLWFPGLERKDVCAMVLGSSQGLDEGEVMMYGLGGNTLRMKKNGDVEITVARVGGQVIVNGDLTVHGQVRDSFGSLEGFRKQYSAHSHEPIAPAGPLPPLVGGL